MKKTIALSLLVTLALSADALAGVRVSSAPGFDKGEVEPAELFSDFDTTWEGLQWSSWGGKRAVAEGRYVTPLYEENGDLSDTSLSYPVRVELSVIRRCGGRLYYMRQLTVFTGELPTPDSSDRFSVTYECPDFYLPSRCVNHKVRPRSVVVACGDGNLQLRRMKWRKWGYSTATGTGTARANDCIPYCARGTFRSVRVKVTLSRLEPCGEGLQYTRLRYRYVGSIPSQLQPLKRSGSAPFPCEEE